MRISSIATSLVLLATAHSFAADAFDHEQGPNFPVTSADANTGDFTWDGAYIGLKGNVNLSDKSGARRIPRKTPELGVFGGYNVQQGNIVYGVEGDVNYLKAQKKGEEDVRGSGIYGTARGRVGYAAGRLLPYVTAGVAAGNIKSQGTETQSKALRYGFVVGAGVDMAVTDNVLLRTSYQYLKFKNGNADAFSKGAHQVGLGLAVKF